MSISSGNFNYETGLGGFVVWTTKLIGVARLCRPGPTTKVPPFETPQICLQHLDKNNHILCLLNIRNNKAFWTSESNTHTLKYVLFFILSFKSCFFCLSLTFSLLVFLFFCLLCACIYVPGIIRQIFSLWWRASGWARKCLLHTEVCVSRKNVLVVLWCS